MDPDNKSNANNPADPVTLPPVSAPPPPPAPTIEPNSPDLSSGSHRGAFLLGIVAVFLLVGLAAGVYLVQRQQDIRSKAAECAQKWPADPNTDCGRSTQQPAQNATGVSLTPNFHWDYGGYPSGACLRSSGCGTYYANVYLWKGNCLTSQDGCGDSNLVASCSLGTRSGQPYQDAPFSCFRQWRDGPTLQSLEPNTAYTWRPAPGADGIVHAEQSWNYVFTTGAGSQTVSCNQTCNTTTLLCSSQYDCAGGKCVSRTCPTTQDASCNCPQPAPTCDSVRMTPEGLGITTALETRSLTASGTGTDLEYTWETTGGTLNMPGNEVGSNTVVWTAPATLPTILTSWTISATVKDSTGQVSTVGGCTKTLTYTPLTSAASCQMVLADKDLGKIQIGDTITFSGWGMVSSDTQKVDKINFIILKDDVAIAGGDTTVDAVRDTTKDSGTNKSWKGTQTFKVTDPGSYSVRIRAHWLKADGTGEWKE